MFDDFIITVKITDRKTGISEESEINDIDNMFDIMHGMVDRINHRKAEAETRRRHAEHRRQMDDFWRNK